MAGYRATVKYRCWKQHTCSGCGCSFRYVVERTAQGQGATREAASAAAGKTGSKAISEGVDQHRTPSEPESKANSP